MYQNSDNFFNPITVLRTPNCFIYQKILLVDRVPLRTLKKIKLQHDYSKIIPAGTSADVSADIPAAICSDKCDYKTAQPQLVFWGRDVPLGGGYQREGAPSPIACCHLVPSLSGL